MVIRRRAGTEPGSSTAAPTPASASGPASDPGPTSAPGPTRITSGKPHSAPLGRPGTSARAGLRIAVLALLWGSTFLWIDLALRDLSPAQVTVARCLLGALTLGVWSRVRGASLPRGVRTWGHITVAALLCNALPFTLFSLGQQSVDSGPAGVLNATTPLWSLLLGLGLGTERRPRPARLAGLLLGFAGTLLIFAPWEQGGSAGRGVLAILGAAACYAAAFTYMQRNLTGRGLPTLSLSTAQLLAATVLTALALPLNGALSTTPGPVLTLDVPPTTVGAVLALGVLTTGVTFHLTYRIIADEGATDAATVGYLLPVVSVVLGVLVLGEQVHARVVLGTLVVLAGVALTRRKSRTAESGRADQEGGSTAPRLPVTEFEALKSGGQDAAVGTKTLP